MSRDAGDSFRSLLEEVARLDVDDVDWADGDALCGDRFTLGRRLGGGGMGVVFAAMDNQRSVPVALKTARRLGPRGQHGLAEEFRLLDGIRHPGVVRSGELYCDRDRWFFSMERLYGLPLSKARCPTRRAAIATARALAETLAAIHLSDCIHCDVKPSNIMVEADGRVVVLDFGIAVHAGSSESHARGAAGTHAYMAPELVLGEPPTIAADWYSFGVLLGELMAQTADAVASAIDRPSAEGVAEIMHVLTHADPRQRLQGAAVLEALGRLQSEGGMDDREQNKSM